MIVLHHLAKEIKLDQTLGPFSSELLSNEEKKRFDRQFRLPGWNQDLLKLSSVLIVGIGGLGVEVAKNLAMVGVGHLVVVDLDTIEYSNLNRHFNSFNI